MARSVLIISSDEDGDFKLDLGDTSPAEAYTMLKSAINSLWECMPIPKITSYEDVIFDPYVWDEDDD